MHDLDPPEEDPNYVTTDANLNAISDTKSMVDMHIYVEQSQINRIFRRYAMIVHADDSEFMSFSGYLFGVQLYKLMRAKKRFRALRYDIQVKEGLSQENDTFPAANRIQHENYDPLAVFIQHLSAAALGFIHDDEAASVSYDRVRREIRGRAYSRAVGSFVQSIGRGQARIKNPKKYISGDLNFGASLIIHALSTGDHPGKPIGIKQNLKLKSSSEDDETSDVVAPLEAWYGERIVFYLEVGDRICFNFALEPSPLPGSIEALGRVFITCVAGN